MATGGSSGTASEKKSYLDKNGLTNYNDKLIQKLDRKYMDKNNNRFSPYLFVGDSENKEKGLLGFDDGGSFIAHTTTDFEISSRDYPINLSSTHGVKINGKDALDYSNLTNKPYIAGKQLNNSITASELASALKTEIGKLVYPVGAIYISTSSTSPSSLFGGTWQRIQDTFLLACGSTYSAGSTGGEANVTLTAEQLPKLTGTAEFRDIDLENSDTFTSASGVFNRTTRLWSGTHASLATKQKSNPYFNILGFDVGNDEAHNNMPPYLAVYVWKRTA